MIKGQVIKGQGIRGQVIKGIGGRRSSDQVIKGGWVAKDVTAVSGDAADEARLDRWLWAVRLYKTRQEAVEACRAGRVRIDDQPAKPARMVRPGQIVRVRRDGG